MTVMESANVLARFESWTARMNGRVVACGGIIPIWNGREQVWALISDTIGAQGMVLLTRAVKRRMAMHERGRIEAHVAVGFKAGHRWMKILGFKPETGILRQFLPDGRNAVQYVRIR